MTAFTLIELIVAFSITGFMVFVFHAIFNEATTAARRSAQSSDMLHRAYAFEEQIRVETKVSVVPGDATPAPNTAAKYENAAMLGPFGATNDPASPVQPGGVLVIIQHLSGNPADPDDDLVMASGSLSLNGIQTRADIRSDQLMFVYNQSGTPIQHPRLTPLAPAWDDSFGGDMTFSEWSDYVRIWYGHVAQTDEYGIANAGTDDLGVGGNNLYPIEWTLGRHAMFTAKDADANGIPDYTELAPPGVYQDYYVETGNPGQFPPSGSLGLRPGDAIVGFGGTMNMALADVTARPWTDIASNSMSPAAYLDPGNANSPPDYNTRVLSMTFFQQRMWVMPRPDLIDGAPALANFLPWAAARTHPIFLNNVSDFIVEFAHDYYEDQEYGGSPQPDGKIDTFFNADGDLEIRWYSWYANNDGNTGETPGNYGRPSLNVPNFPGPDHPITWLPPLGADNPAHVDLSGAGDYASAAFVWGHYGSMGYQEGSTSPSVAEMVHRWPWLIRIRYRLHDRLGEFRGRTLNEWAGATGSSIQELGQWFEIVIPVNHQAPGRP